MATEPAKKWNDEEHVYEDVVDENGNPVMAIGCIEGKKVSEDVLPFLNELVDALKGDK